MAFEAVAEEKENLRNIRGVQVEFDSAGKLRETEEYIIVPAILDREGILDGYCYGSAYRSWVEIKAAAFTLDEAWVVAYEHTPKAYITDRAAIRGRVKNVVADEAIHALRADIYFFKALCDEALLGRVRDGTLSKDASSAYFCNEIPEAGEFAGQPYDRRQEAFMFHHVAVGIPQGRCPSPYCGLQMDSFPGFLRVNVRDPDLFVCSLATVAEDIKAGIYAVVGKLKRNLAHSGYAKGDAVIRDFLFESSKGWTPERADAWVKEHGKVDTTSTPGVSGPRSKLDSGEVLARSRRLLHGNMSSTGDRL